MRTPLLIPLLLLAPTCSAAAATPSHTSIRHPTARTQVVLRVASGGGFVAPQVNLRAVPSFTLYGDGTIVVPGPVIQIYPGPAILPLVRSKLAERRVQAILARARAAGLLARGAIDYGMPGVSDMPTTTLSLNADGRQVTRRAYALGATAGGRPLPAKQAKARRALATFIAGLPHGLAGSRYTPHAIAVYVQPASGQAQPGSRPVVWPLKSNLATAGKRGASGLDYRCITVSGADVPALLSTLRRANELSRWKPRAGSGSAYSIVARPLLPDERACP